MKALFAVVLLASLAACSSAGTDSDPAASRPVSAQPLPFAPPPPPMPEEGRMCAQDVRLCADGSTVSRNPHQGCAFDPCPGANNP